MNLTFCVLLHVFYLVSEILLKIINFAFEISGVSVKKEGCTKEER